MSDELPSAPELVASYLARHDWRASGAGDEPPRPRTLSLWEKWIDFDPERAWPLFLEFVRARPEDDDVLELVWARLRHLLARHGRAFHARVLALVASNARLRRIAPPRELELAAYRPKPLDVPELVAAYVAQSSAHDDAHELSEVVRHDPDVGTRLALEIVERGPGLGLRSYDTHDPLEALLAAHGAAVVDRVEAAARSSVLVRRALWWISRGRGGSVPMTADKISDDVFARLEAARGGTTDYNSDDTPGDPSVLLPEHERLVEAWFTYDSKFWAWERVGNLVRNDPDPAWTVIRALVVAAPSERVLGAVGAGPLEDFLSAYGVVFIDRIEAWARGDEWARACLRSVWQTDTPDSVWERVLRARGDEDDTG